MVAAPRLVDTHFARSVVLVLDHGEQGALGVVLDRPGATEVRAVLPRWHPVATPPAVLFVGGPVGRNSVVGLARLAKAGSATATGANGLQAPAGWQTLIDDDRPIGMVGLHADPEPSLVSGILEEVRLFSGFAGWEPGQLEDEIDEGWWFDVEAQAQDPLSADPEGLWRRVLRRQGGSLAILAGLPADPSTN